MISYNIKMRNFWVKHQSIFKRSVVLCAILISNQCSVSQKSNYETVIAKNEIAGFSFFDKIIGLWSGPVFSDTPAGSAEVWYVDFRPVSASQVSQFTSFDANTINYTSFFIVKHEGILKIAMRTEGVFMNKGCVTYEVMDSVDEANGYYRFSDFQSGIKRAYTEFIFSGEELIMQTFTTKFNTQQHVTLHSKWQAKLGDRSAANKTKELFGYPQPVMVKDFSDVFRGMNESIFYTFENDPYSTSSQPYVGSVTVNIIKDKRFTYAENHELFLVLTTESIFDGFVFDPEDLKYFSKYVFLPIKTESFTFQNVHPGTYFLYSFNDVNGDKKHSKGDYMSSDQRNSIEVSAKKNVIVETTIDFIIP